MDPAGEVSALRAELQHLRREIELRDAATAKALDLQARETERRLHDLNGEASRLRQMQAEYVPRELWEAAQREVRIVAEANVELRAAVGNNKSEMERLSSGFTWLTRLVVGALVTAAIFAAVAAIVGSLAHAKP